MYYSLQEEIDLGIEIKCVNIWRLITSHINVSMKMGGDCFWDTLFETVLWNKKWYRILSYAVCTVQECIHYMNKWLWFCYIVCRGMGCSVMGLVCNMEYLQCKSVRHGVYGIAAVIQHLNDRPARNTTYYLFHKYLFQMPVIGNLL